MRKTYLKLALLFTCFAGAVQGQTWIENDKLVSANREANAYFSAEGNGVSVSGDYAVVGAPREDYSGYSEAGRAYVYKKDANCNWVLSQVINPPYPGAGDYFGHAVAVYYDFMVISARNDDEDENETNTMNSAGAAYIYENISGTWTFTQKIVASDREVSGVFGHDVDISSSRIIVGAPLDDQGGGASYLANAGAAYIFDYNGTSWSETQKLVPTDRGAQDWFGVSVSVFGDNAVVGAYQEDEDSSGSNSLTNSGSAYFFENTSGSWSQLQKVTSTDRENYEYFGMHLDMEGTYAIIGCHSDDHDENGTNALTAAGSAYVFRKSSGVWSVDQKLDASDRTAGDRFGYSVAIGKEFAVVGAYIENHDAAGANYLSAAGSAYIYQLSSSGWSQLQKIVPSDREAEDRFGSSAAIWDDDIIVGAIYEDEDDGNPPSNTLSSAGSAYMFGVGTPPSTPTVTASSTSVCSGGSTTLYASGSLGDASNWQWYEGSCNSTPIGTGSSITVSPTSTTTYYVNGVGGCVTAGTCGSITISIAASSWHQTTENTLVGDTTYDVAIDGAQNVYVAGSFSNETTLNGGNNPDISIATGVGPQTASYVAKYNACGDLLWEAHAEESKHNRARDIVVDEANGVVYIVGEYYSNVMFVTSSGCTSAMITSTGAARGYVAAFDMNTGCAISIDPVIANTWTTVSSIALNEATGDIYVGGNESSSVAGTPYTSYVVKYSPTSSGIGSVVASIVSNNANLYNNEVNDLDFDEQHHLLWIIGDFEEKVAFSPGAGTLIALSGIVQDAYLLAYEDAGSSFGTVFNQLGNSTYYMSGEGIAVDPSSGIPFMTGTYRGGIGDPFDFGVLNSLPTMSGFSGYCASYDLGSTGWTRYFNSPGSYAEGTAVTHDGDYAYFAGTFSYEDVDVQTLGTYPYSVIGSPLNYNHTIVTCFKNDGNGVWANVTEDPGSNTAIHESKGIAASDDDHVFVTGVYTEKMDYWYTSGAAPLASTGSGSNGYILRVEKGSGDLFKTGDREDDQLTEATSTHLSVYPNPTSSSLTLQIDDYDSEATYKGLLMNAMGQVVRSQTITTPTTVLDLSDYPAGIYFLVINDGTQSQTVRISKNN
tara:strand:- start:2978 stop:6289 length:3312 start_codon:yes stop_codon:yes gene_type:complete